MTGKNWGDDLPVYSGPNPPHLWNFWMILIFAGVWVSLYLLLGFYVVWPAIFFVIVMGVWYREYRRNHR